MNITLKLTLLLSSYVLSFYFGWYLGNKENAELRNRLLDSAESDVSFHKLETKRNLNMLFALKEGKIDLVEGFLASELKRSLKYPMYSKTRKMDDITSAIYEDAKRFQKLYCSDLCLGVGAEGYLESE